MPSLQPLIAKPDDDHARELQASYHKSVASPLKLIDVVKHAAPIMRRWLVDADALDITHMAVSGISGMSVGFPLSMELNLPTMMVRKPGEQAHTGMLVGSGALRDYVILDDLIASGNTINRITRDVVMSQLIRHLDYDGKVENFAPPICRGIFLYHHAGAFSGWRSEFTTSKPIQAAEHHDRNELAQWNVDAFNAYRFQHPTIPVINVEK